MPARRDADRPRPASEREHAGRRVPRLPDRIRPAGAEFQVEWHGFRLDALYRAERLIVELDGRRDHDQFGGFEEERRRDALALELGFATIRITWRRLRREPVQLANQLRTILAARAQSSSD